jgi:hypothetical protein
VRTLAGAEFSPCRKYRYRLWRQWDRSSPSAVFVMLNPSTADETENDQTVERCERRARAMGFGGVRVANIFALRSTDPAALPRHRDPVGPGNDVAILKSVTGAGIVVCAWGGHGRVHQRGEIVVRLLREHGVALHYLKLNKDGTPKHPLYVAYSVQPQLWEAP